MKFGNWLGIAGRLRRWSYLETTISADTDDAAPLGIGRASRWIVHDTTGGHKLTGLAAGEMGDELTIEYASDAAGVLILSARDPLSSTANWFILRSNVTLKPMQAITLRYGYGFLGTPGWFPKDDRFGTAANHDATEFGLSYTDTAICAVIGAKVGAVIDTSTLAAEVSNLSPSEYAYPSGGSTWDMWAYPAPVNGGVLTLDVRRRAIGNTAPGSGDSICASAKPSFIGNGSDIVASGSLSTWTGSPIIRRDMLSIAVVTNTALAKWVALRIPARRALT